MRELTEERLLDLLCQKATDGLDAEELKQLEELEEAFPDWKDDESFELAAAAINLTSVDADEKMPAHLESKLLASAESFFQAAEDDAVLDQQEISEPETSAATETAGEMASNIREVVIEEPKAPFWQWLGWGVAALACLVLVANIYMTRVTPEPEIAEGSNKNGATQTPTPPLTDAEKRAQIVNSGEDILKVDVAEAAPGKMPKITGDIVWDNKTQKGYMRFRGMPVNDASKEQYQLWIFDENQDEKFPIDGGVFNVNKDGEVIIPIDAKIDVKKPTLFAVTKEKPGGVVVSDRKGIIAVAKVL